MNDDRRDQFDFVSDRAAALYTKRVLGLLLNALGVSDHLRSNGASEWSVCQETLVRFREEFEELTESELSLIGVKRRDDLEEATWLAAKNVLGSIGLETQSLGATGTEPHRRRWYGVQPESLAQMVAVVGRREAARNAAPAPFECCPVEGVRKLFSTNCPTEVL